MAQVAKTGFSVFRKGGMFRMNSSNTIYRLVKEMSVTLKNNLSERKVTSQMIKWQLTDSDVRFT